MKPEKRQKNFRLIWLDEVVVTTSIDEVWDSALTTVSASKSHTTGAKMKVGPRKLMSWFSKFQLCQLQGQQPTSGFPPRKLVFILDFWVLGKQIACFLLFHLPFYPAPHKAGCSEVTLPFFFAEIWKQLHLCHLLPPILTLSWFPPSFQAVGVVYGQGCLSFLLPRSPPFPCNNAVIWWSESATPFYLPEYSHSLWGKVRLTNESWVPPADQLLGQSNHMNMTLIKHIRDRNLLGV